MNFQDSKAGPNSESGQTPARTGEGVPATAASAFPPASAAETSRPLADYAMPGPGGRTQRRLAYLRQYWWLPVLTLGLALVAGSAYLLLASPKYVASARMWETEKLRLPEATAFSENTENYFGTQIELLRSEKLALATLTRLLASDTNAVPRGKDRKPLGVRLNIIPAPKSTVFVVQALSSDQAYTQAYLTALMEEYLAYKKDIRKIVSGDTLASISEQVLRLERELKSDQEALTAFQRTNNLAVLEEESRIAGGYLARLKTQRSDFELEAQLLQATALDLEGVGAGNLSTAESVVDAIRGAGTSTEPRAPSQRLTALRELELLKSEREKWSKYLRPKHPDIIRLDAQIERAQKLIELFQSQNREQLATARQALTMKLSSVESSIKEWESKVVQANVRIAEAERLKLAVSRTQSLYDRVITLLQNVDISRNIDQETLAILDPASPAKRSYRQEAQMFGLTLLGGLLVGLGMVFLMELRDDRFHFATEVNERFGDSIVGQVPEVRELRHKAAPHLLANGDEPHIYAESYRNLRSALLFLPCAAQRPRVLLITSALPGEGKSTIAANLAHSLALGGSRVLLVDGDLRKGCLHEMLSLAVAPGLAELLRKPEAFAQSVQTDSLRNLFFLSRGNTSDHPGDLFLGQGLEQVLARSRQDFDYVLIDSSPVFAADDVATLAPKADGTLFVVRRRFSRACAVREALELLTQRQAKVVGLVFNRADATAHSYYYGKYTGPKASAKEA